MSIPLETLVIALKIVALASICSSVWLIQHIARNKIKRKKIYHRIILGMSCVDLLSTLICSFIGSWAIPADTKKAAFQPKGNQITCNIQGVIVNMFASSMLYNLSLMIYYLLVIKYSYKDSNFRVIEPAMHVFCWGYGIVTGIAGVFMNLFHNVTFYCWVSVDEDVHRETRDRWLFVYMPAWVVIIASAVILLVIYCHVRKIESEIAWVRTNNNRSDENKISKNAARQALLYLLAFLAVWICPSIVRLLEATSEVDIVKNHPALLVITVLLAPQQGFFNTLVYTEKSYRTLGKKYSNLNFAAKTSIIFNGRSEEEARQISINIRQKSTVSSRIEMESP